MLGILALGVPVLLGDASAAWMVQNQAAVAESWSTCTRSLSSLPSFSHLPHSALASAVRDRGSRTNLKIEGPTKGSGLDPQREPVLLRGNLVHWNNLSAGCQP